GHRSVQGPRSRGHHFTAPAVTPRVSVRWKIRKKRNVGSSDSSAPAFNVGTSSIRSPCSEDSAMGMVWLSLLVSITSGMKNSFQVQMKKKIISTDIVGRTTG